MMAATDPKTYRKSVFKRRQAFRNSNQGLNSGKTTVLKKNRSNRSSTLVNQSLLAEKDCENEMMIVRPEQKEKRLTDFGYRPEEHKPKPMRTVLALRAFWNLYGTEVFKMIASHLDLSSLKIFMFLSKNIYYSLFYQKSSDNSWAVDIYYKFFSNTCIIEKGIERAINCARIDHQFFQSPFCNQKMINEYKGFCTCPNCVPVWMKPDQHIGWISYSHAELCREPYCDCGFAPDCFVAELHSNWKTQTEMYFTKRTDFLCKKVEVSMTPVALKKFNEFSLSEVIKLDKKNFRINRWFRFASLLSGRILHAFIQELSDDFW